MLQRLGQRTEFWIVMVVVYGYLVLGAMWDYVHLPHDAPISVSDADILLSLAYELVTGAAVILLLRARGIPWAAFRPRISWVDTWHGSLLFLASVLTMSVTYGFATALPGAEERLAAPAISGTTSVGVVLLASLLNPIYEEWFHVGYVQERLRQHGLAVALGASILLRLLIHSYEGAHAVVGVLPTGALFGLYAWRTGRVWPIVIAHGFLDLVSLLAVHAG